MTRGEKIGLQPAAYLLAALSAVGCATNGTGSSANCVINSTRPCICQDGTTGSSICLDGRTYSACQCGSPGSGGAAGLGDQGGAAGIAGQSGAAAGGAAGQSGAAGKSGAAGGVAGQSGTAGGVAGQGGAAGAAGGGTSGGGGGTSGGGGGTGGGGGAAGSAGGGAVTSGGTPTIPAKKGTCPNIAGANGQNLTFAGNAVTVWAGPANAKGPMVFYWHGTGMASNEAISGLGQAAINEVRTSGGVIASFNTTNGQGTNTGDLVWFTGDFDTADEILACANEQGLVDVTHIHSAGYSAGGLQTGAMVYARGYMASVLCYSGGVLFPGALPDPSNHPAMVGAHGPPGVDVFAVDLAQTTIALENDLKGKGSFVIDCQDTGDHVTGIVGRMGGAAAPAWQFFKDHPFKVNPEPYTSLPAGFPTYCKII